MSNSIIDRLLSHAQRQPDAPAIYWRQSILSYQQLVDKVMALAAAFRKSDDQGPVAVHLSRTPDLIATLLASWYSGRAFVALDPKHPPHRRQMIISESQPALVVYDIRPPIMESDLLQRHIQDLLKTPATVPVAPLKSSDDTAYLLYTSGSTGKPKGIAIEHHSVQALVDWAQEYYQPDQLRCVLASTTITFDLAVFEIFVPLATGNALWLVDSVLDLFNTDDEYAALTLINTVPSAGRELIRADAIPHSVSTVNLAGEALHWKLINDIYQHSQVQNVNNLWGPSEDTTYSTVFTSRRDDERPDSGPVPIGFPVSGSSVFIVDDQLQPVATGEAGEICLAGAGLAKGYHNNPVLTAERFPLLTDPDGNALRIYRTGDWGHQDPNGMLHFHGRIDFQVKIRGHRIELEEPEQALLMLDEVREAAVIVRTHKEEQKLIVILVKSRHDQSDTELIQRCQHHLKETLPAYMMPHGWYVHPAALPRTTSGKICRRTLSASYQEEKKSGGSSSSVMALIEEVLGFAPDMAGTFLDAGGDSLSAVRLHTLLRSRLRKSLDLSHILSPTETLSYLHQKIEELPEDSEAPGAVVLEDNHLSAVEYRMLKVYKTHPSPGSYNIGLILHFDAAVDIPRLRQATLTALTHSRALACSVELDPQGAYYRPVDIRGVWRQLSASDFNSELQREFFSQPFRLEQQPPVRAILLEQGEGRCSLLLSFAHTAVDGEGLRALLCNIASLYQGETLPPQDQPRLTLPSEARSRAALNYWQRELAGFQATSPWPQGLDSRPDSIVSWTLDAEERGELAAACRDQGITLPVMLMGTLFIALQRLSGCEDLVIATPVANRQQAGMQECVANMTNSLPLRCRLREESTTQEVLAQVQQQLANGLLWQDVAIDRIVEQLSEDIDKEALFDIIFSYMDFLQDAFTLPGVPVQVDFYQPESAKAPLVVSAIVTDNGGLQMVFEYQGYRLHPDWVNTLSQLFGHLLEQRSLMKGASLQQLEPIPPSQQPMLQELQAAKPLETATSLVDWLADSAGHFASRIAIQDGDNAVTYAQLWQESERLAAGLQAQGVAPGDAIGVHLEKNWRLIAALCAVLRTGGFYVPLDPRNPEERNRYISQHSRIRFAITTGDGPFSFPTIDYDTLAQSDSVFTPVPVTSDDLAYIIFTSGTTGRPKGVTITHHNVCRLFTACQQWGAFNEKDSWTLFHSYAFDFSVWEIFGALLYGGRLVIVHPSEAADMPRFAALLEQHRISVLSLTPTAFRNFIGSTGTTLRHLPRLLIFGGEALRTADLQPWWQSYGTEATRLINMYGITEITVHATAHEMLPQDRMSCIGRPLADTGVLLCDSRGQPCPVGVPGELCISGDGVSPGYYDAPDLNQQRFGFITQYGTPQRYYFSGDLAIINSSGQLCYLGRRDKQVKINGHRVELDEVSGVLQKMPDITATVVRVVTIDSNSRMLVAWYVAERDIAPQALAKQLSQELPFWAVPEKLLRIPALPLTVNGKVDESQLPDPLNAVVAREQQSEHPVQHIWQQILHNEMLPDDLPFFEAGGTSIKAALLVQRLNALLGKPALSLIDIFRHPCIRDQQQLVDKLLAGETT